MDKEKELKLTERAAEDPEAFALLYDHYLPVVFRYVSRKVANRAEAEDITSQTFEKALKSIKKLKKGTSFKVWLYRIAGNTIIDHYRQKGRRQTYPIEEADLVPDSESAREVERVENRAAVMSLLEEIPETHRTALVLHFLEGLTISEMSEVLGITRSACYMRIYRATSALADRMEEAGIGKS